MTDQTRSGPRAGRSPYALVGAGEFGATLVAQSRRIPELALAAVCDRDVARAKAALAAGGYDGDAIRVAGSRAEALAAIEGGRIAVLEDSALLADLPLKAVVEATGDPFGAAAVADQALGFGYHVAMATKEAEVVVGPELARRAKAAGLVHTLVEGDQPSLLCQLIQRAQALGFPVVAAGKSTESDYVYDPQARTITAWGRTEHAPDGYDALFAPADPVARIGERAIPSLATATVPDHTEMTIVANQCGLQPDTAAMHGPVARTVELADVFGPKDDGGILSRSGVVDVFTCLRRPDELSFAGGVFVVVETPDPATGRLLASKGMPGSRSGRRLMLHNPVHLLGAEVGLSLLSALKAGRGTGGEAPRQRFDVVGRTRTALKAGHRFTLGRRHAFPDLEPLIQPAAALSGSSPLPYYLLPGATLLRDVPAGHTLTAADVSTTPDSALWRLREAQDGAGLLG